MNRKYMFAAAVLSLAVTAAAENGSTADFSPQTAHTAEATAEDAAQQGQDGSGFEKNGANRETGNDPAGNNDAENQELIFIGGKVRSVSQDSFVISRTLFEDSADGQGSNVLIPEAGSPEEELVTVRCMESTVFIRWTIKGSGEDIKEEDAAFSELQEGTGLEAQGYFDGDEFMAEKVIIEIYE